MQYEKHILFGNMGQVLAASAVQMYGDNVRFQEHQKTCDTLNNHSDICHDHRYRYPISDKNAKKGKSQKLDSPPRIMKLTKNDCCSKVMIYCIMSTN